MSTSALGFDPRPYCERLAEARPDRFKFITERRGNNPWALEDHRPAVVTGHFHAVWGGCDTGYLWMFFGVLSDERNLRTVAWRIEYHHAASLLESIIAAVVESFEVRTRKYESSSPAWNDGEEGV